jgi:hypothetical protein
VELWEKGRQASLIERGLLLLRAAFPAAEPEELVRLTLGQRDACVLRLRELTVGPEVHARSTCPDCGERLEFSFAIREVQTADFSSPVPMCHEYVEDGFEVRFRPVTNADLLALRHYQNPAAARGVLVSRVLISVRRHGDPVPAEAVPPELVAKIGELLAERDAQSEIRFRLVCASCGRPIPALFDIVPFFWRELSARAELLLVEVRAIARAYGWTESETLAMSSAKRRFYLEATR